MKRVLAIASVLVVAAAVVLVASGAGGDSGGAYRVRAIFMNAFSVIPGEDVKIAGVKVGKIESMDVTPDHRAAVVLRIDKPGFDDFRRDAECTIRPQSLIGEKFVDCRPTLPRAPNSKLPPALKQIPDGQPGAGQYLLPFENNSTSVDPDLINNINQLTYVQRFRLILNELGAGLAGRGEDIEEVVKRANPLLRDTDRIFGILSAQRNQLAQLATDSEQILAPLARERSSIAGFFSNAGAAAQASAEKGTDLEASLRKLPGFLRELRQTMASFEYFSNSGTPVVESLGKAAPSLTKATRALTPFSAASTVSLKSLGANGEVAGPNIHAADPVVKKLRDVARSGASPTTELANFLVSTKKTGGFDGLVDLIYNSTAAINEFDRYGHFTRSLFALTNCIDYVSAPTTGCSANFNGEGSSESASASDALALYRELQEELGAQTGGTSAAASSARPAPPTPTPAPQAPSLGEGEQLGASAKAAAPQRALLDYLLGP